MQSYYEFELGVLHLQCSTWCHYAISWAANTCGSVIQCNFHDCQVKGKKVALKAGHLEKNYSQLIKMNLTHLLNIPCQPKNLAHYRRS